MKVIHINTSDTSSGAAIAGYRLHQGLLERGINSHLLVGGSQTQSDRISSISRNHQLETLLSRVTIPLGLNYVNIISTFDIGHQEFYQEADILNFHNLHGGYFNYLAIPHLTQSKPAVFTLHDMWSFTGHCAYSYDCDRWKSGCGQCPYPDTYPNIHRDNTQIEWKLKKWVYSRSQLAIVTLSNWLTVQVKQSLLNGFPIHHIPNGIDTEVYQPLDRELCKNVLGIPLSKKVLLFGAHSLSDPRKGGDLLLKAIQSLPESLKAETILLTLGDGSAIISAAFGMTTLNLGYVSSDRLKSIAYSAADLFVFPTREDNLPLVLQESMACGTPMVSFKVGGVPDLVRPDITGYLAAAEDAEDMASGIVQLLEDRNLRDRMSQQCRAVAVEEYSLELQAQRYIDLYSKVLKIS